MAFALLAIANFCRRLVFVQSVGGQALFAQDEIQDARKVSRCTQEMKDVASFEDPRVAFVCLGLAEHGALCTDLKAFDVQVWIDFLGLLGHQADECLLEVLDLPRIHLGRDVLQQALNHVQEDAGDLDAVLGCFGRPHLHLGLDFGVPGEDLFPSFDADGLGDVVLFLHA